MVHQPYFAWHHIPMGSTCILICESLWQVVAKWAISVCLHVLHEWVGRGLFYLVAIPIRKRVFLTLLTFGISLFIFHACEQLFTCYTTRSFNPFADLCWVYYVSHDWFLFQPDVRSISSVGSSSSLMTHQSKVQDGTQQVSLSWPLVLLLSMPQKQTCSWAYSTHILCFIWHSTHALCKAHFHLTTHLHTNSTGEAVSLALVVLDIGDHHIMKCEYPREMHSCFKWSK